LAEPEREARRFLAEPAKEARRFLLEPAGSGGAGGAAGFERKGELCAEGCPAPGKEPLARRFRYEPELARYDLNEPGGSPI
jgi:hypothetical protein